MVGFMGSGVRIFVDDLNVKIDKNNDGNYTTNEIVTVEDFEVNTDGSSDVKFAYDAAGNQTFDGVYAQYDA